jgi:tripartite-type tricarboxylate transporter receptor subunit TctC
VAPAGLPDDIAQKLLSELKVVAQDPGVQERLKQLSAVPSGLAGEEFGRFIKSELEKWGPVVEKAGIKTQ